jgi:hypothetical protein
MTERTQILIHKKKRDYIIHEGTAIICTKEGMFGLHGIIMQYNKETGKYSVELRAGGLGQRMRISLDREDFDIDIHGVL